jgi:hypothetical protein
MHALPVTARFVYTDVVSLAFAAVTAAILTSVWVWTDPEFVSSTKLPNVAENNDRLFVSQDKFGYDDRTALNVRQTPPSVIAGPPMRFSDGSPVAERITRLLDSIPTRKLSESTSETSWQTQVVQRATQMWREGKITTSLSNRQDFMQAGLHRCWSFSECNDGQLTIVAGFLDDVEVEVYQDRYTDKLAYL